VAAALVASLLPRVASATPGRLSPSSVVLDLGAGQSRGVDYTLALDAEPPGPTDLFLLVDTSASMLPYLPDLRRGLLDTMVRLRWPGLGVGVGEFRTTSPTDWHDGLTYRALRRVGAVDSALARAVDRLGRDQARLPQAVPGAHPHTVALEQMVTGDGHPPYVSAGQQAGFRPGARTIAVVITAAPFAADPTQPSRADAIAALREAGVEVFGLALDGAALPDLTSVAQGTGSLTETTVDCGAGRRIPSGRPTACTVSPRALGGALAGMLYERRRGIVTVSVTGSGVRRLTPRTFSVDLNVPSRTALRLDVACAVGDAGRTHDIGLAASLSGTVVARASLTAHCRAR
jgi:hypothetical protein